MEKIAKIPESDYPRVVILGAGFAGLKLARDLSRKKFQVILFDKNNYHQFQPLFYQVATAGLEPSSISFPLRKLFQNKKNIHFRMAEVLSVNKTRKHIQTTIGELSYDHLVVATGATSNFFGIEEIKENALPMKSTTEALQIRNMILEKMEKALSEEDSEGLDVLLNYGIVGGGPTGVELAGALAEMRNTILPKDYPELDFDQMEIHLFQGADRILDGMSLKSSKEAEAYLKKLGVTVHLNAMVNGYKGNTVSLKGGESYKMATLIWAAGVKSEEIKGLGDKMGKTGRLIVDEFNRISGTENTYAIGDIALMEKFGPNGHPQVAQVAIQQASHLGKNFIRRSKNKAFKPFEYKDKGTLATIGRNLAVADLPRIHLKGTIAWVLWLFVHLMAILGVRNKLVIFLNWSWNYFTYDQALRLLIKHKQHSAD